MASTASLITFPCSRCQRTLQIAGDAAGKQAQCPECGAIVTVPWAQPKLPVVPKSPFDEPPKQSPTPAAGSAVTSRTGPLPSMQMPPSAADATTDGGPATSGVVAPPQSLPPTAPSNVWGEMSRSTSMSPVKQLFDRIMVEIRKVYVGQDELVLGTLVALFSGGHVLIESVPGLGKTLFVRTLGRVLGCKFGRIQFTADLMPSDITGSPIFDMKNAGVPLSSRPGLHAASAGRRNQPLAGQDARGAVGDHAGVSRDRRAHEPQARAAVSGAGDAEPDRERGDVQPARGAARPVHVQDRDRLPGRDGRSGGI